MSRRRGTQVQLTRESGAHVVVTVQPGTGPIVLLAHGVGSSSRFLFEAFAPPLAEAGWRLAAMDLRGHGESSPLPRPDDHALRLHAGDLAMAARALEVEVVGGVSLGGHAAVAAAVEGLPWHVRAVAAVLPAWTGPSRRGEGPHAAVAAEVRAHGIAGMLARLRHATDVPAWLRDLLVRDYAVHDPDSLEAALLALDGGDAPGRDDLAALTTPIALVSWPDDPGHPDAVAHEWAKLIAAPVGHRSTTIDDVGRDRTSFGRALVNAFADLDLQP